ncbi:MAG: nuclear transport factor 2 family protein [Myxococcota bacterium]
MAEAHPESLDHMLAAWNEADPAKVRSHLTRALAPEVHFVDPANDITGIDAFEAMVHRVHGEIPGAVYSRASAVDSHHRLHRYHWAIHRDGKLLMPGFDVTETNEAGQVTRVLGFFGELDKES